LQAQLPQALHVGDDSGATRLLLLERLVAFSLAPLIALEHGLGDVTLMRSRHENPFPSGQNDSCVEVQINAGKP
jgi:hypothetical protein